MSSRSEDVPWSKRRRLVRIVYAFLFRSCLVPQRVVCGHSWSRRMCSRECSRISCREKHPIHASMLIHETSGGIETGTCTSVYQKKRRQRSCSIWHGKSVKLLVSTKVCGKHTSGRWSSVRLSAPHPYSMTAKTSISRQAVTSGVTKCCARQCARVLLVQIHHVLPLGFGY